MSGTKNIERIFREACSLFEKSTRACLKGCILDIDEHDVIIEKGIDERIHMRTSICCPVCGNTVSVDVRSNPTEIMEMRYQHLDHYFYIDHDGETRKPKILSDDTVTFLKSKFIKQEHSAGTMQTDEQIRQIIHHRIDELRTAFGDSKSLGVLLQFGVQEIVSQVILDDTERCELEGLLWDEGFKIREDKLDLAISPIADTELRPRSRHIRTMRMLFNEFGNVYTHLHVNILGLKSDEGNYVLSAWLILTPKQEISIGDYSPDGQHIIHYSKLLEIECINELLSNIESGLLLFDGQEYIVREDRIGQWADIRLFGKFREMKSDFSGIEGYGLYRNSGKQIISVFDSLDINNLDFINEGDQVFSNFENFSQRVIGTRINEGHNILVHILAPYWINVIENPVDENGLVTVEWRRPIGFHNKLRPCIICWNEQVPITFQPIDISTRTENGAIVERTVFQINDFEGVNRIQFALLHNIASLINRGKPFLQTFNIWDRPRPQYDLLRKIIETSEKDIQAFETLKISEKEYSSVPLNRSALLEGLFPEHYSHPYLEVSDAELELLRNYNDQDIRDKLARILMQSDVVPNEQKAKLRELSNRPHTGYEISDFELLVEYKGISFQVDFVIKSGMEISSNISESDVWYQIDRPSDHNSDLVVFLSYADLTTPLKNKIRRHSNRIIYIINKELASLFKNYEELT